MPSFMLSPGIAFALCIAIVIGASYYGYLNAKNENNSRYDRTINTFREILRGRLVVYTNALVDTRNLIDIKPNVTESEFREFVSKMGLEENFPGIQTLGKVRRLSIPQARALLKKFDLPFEHARIPRDAVEADIIEYVEYIGEGSPSVRGFDLGSSRVRKYAMDEARDTGKPVASDRVTPIQIKFDEQGNPIAAFLVFVPLYERGKPIDTVEQRRAAHLGFIYGGFRAKSLFGQVADDARFRNSKFFVQVYDGQKVDPDSLMYQEGDEDNVDMSMLRDFSFKFASHEWTVRIIAPHGFSIPSLTWAPVLTFVLGTFISFLIALSLHRTRSFTRRLQDDILLREETERLLNEARNEADAANRAKSIFLANISHEIRTPLGVMIGFTEIALTQTDPKEREESLQFVVRNGKELTRIIGDVLDVSKIEAETLKLEKKTFSLRAMINDLIQIWGPQIEKKNLVFETDIASDAPETIWSDETRIKQVLTNLLSNAVKFTDTGKISLKVSAMKSGTSEAGILRFTVFDTGIGIPHEQRDKLFKPFSQADGSITRRYGGSGLGLSLSRAIAKTLSGQLTLESLPREAGSCFTFAFPIDVEAPDVEAKPPRSADESVTLNGKKILLVDDSPDNRALVSLILKKAGAEVDVARDGEEGIAKAVAKDYHLILMDIQMPHKDGYTAFEEMRSEHNLEVPVIALTAHALVAERDRALSLGFANYVTKPVDAKTLIQIAARTALA